MRAAWGRPPVGNPGRAAALEDFRAHVAARLAKDGALQSVLLSVAQFWADEADDAVHAMLVYSERSTPVWPHACRWHDEGDDAVEPDFGFDRCSDCGMPSLLSHGAFERDWAIDSNGTAIEQFQACCMEGASQDHDAKDAYTPYAVARRTSTGVELEILGGPIRAWLDPAPSRPTSSAVLDPLVELVYASPADDAPRAVLADRLLERGDPRGAYMTTTDPILRTALENEHARAWLGPIADVAPPEHIVMDRGFARAVAVHVTPDAIARIADAHEWGTVEDLWFLPQSQRFFSPQMRALRSVGPLDRAGLAALVARGGELPLERLHVVLDRAGIEALARMDLPRLGTLLVGVGSGDVAAPDLNLLLRRGAVAIDLELLEPLFGARFWKMLDELVIMSTEPNVVEAWIRLPPSRRPARLTFAAPTATEAPGGFTLSVFGREATVQMPALGPEPSLGELARMIDALPADVGTVRFATTRWFAPTEADRELLTRALSRPRTVV